MASSNKAYELPFRRIGRDVFVWEKSQILAPERISIADSVIIDDFVLLMGGEETILGSFIHIAAFSSIVGGGRLIMEDFAGLSGGVRLYTGNEEYGGGSLTNPAVPAPYRCPIRGFVRIAKHAIVGANAVILPNVTIGEGAVVGAGSLVVRDCEPWTVYVGSPARQVKARARERILELEEQLRRDLYDRNGVYIPKSQRERA
jgi:acetyltransferase-like isoleucine patch superfamily enzyme